MSTDIVLTPESPAQDENLSSDAGVSAETRSGDSTAAGSTSVASTVSGLEGRTGVGRQREMTTTTLVRLMGLPTATEFSMLESKIDNLSSKVSTLVSKLERLSGQMPQLFHDFDRTNTQIADLREFVRKALSAVVAHVDTNVQLDDVLSRSSKPAPASGATATPVEDKKAKVLSSE